MDSGSRRSEYNTYDSRRGSSLRITSKSVLNKRLNSSLFNLPLKKAKEANLLKKKLEKHKKENENNSDCINKNKELKKMIVKERKELIYFENYIDNIDSKRINNAENAA